MAGFFGPGGLSGRSEPGLDPQLMEALLAQFPGLQGMQGQPQQPPNSLQSMGYGWQGPTLYSGQGQNNFTLSPFEGAGGSSPESITAGLASGTFGRSASINPLGTPAQSQQQGSLLSLPSLQLPMAQVAAQQGGISDGGMMGDAGQTQGDGGFSISAGDVLGAGQQALDLFGGTQLGQQTTTPGYAEQRAGERVDYSNATGSPGGIPQSLMNPAPISSFLQPGFGADTSFSMGFPQNFGVTSPLAAPQTLAPGTTFEMMGQGQSPVMNAPGGSAQTALGPEGGAAPQGDLLGGGINTLQGLLSLYSGSQTGDIGQLLSGGAGTIGGLSQMAPETIAALSQQLGMGAGGLGLAGGALGGLAGGYGLYQGIQGGDPLQAIMGAGSLYAGAAPVINSLAGTALPTLSEAGMSLLSSLGGGAGATAGASAGAGAGAGTAGATGATAGGAAGGAVAAAPLAAMVIATSIYNMMEQDKLAGQLTNRFGNLQQNIPGHVANLQKAPGLLQALQQPGVTPEQAADIYRQLEQIQTDFDQSGMEDFLQHGRTSVTGPSGQGSMEASFEQGPGIMEALKPYGQALDYGRLLAQDMAGRGGVNIPNPRTAQDYALALGGPEFTERYRPTALLGGGGAQGSGELLDLLGLPHALSQGYETDPTGLVGQPTLNLLGRFNPAFLDGRQFTNADVNQFLQHGAGADIMNTLKNDFDLYGSAWSGGIGKVDRNITNQLNAMQPGGMEAALRSLFGNEQSPNPFFSGQFQQQVQDRSAQDPMLQQLGQFTQGLQGLTQQAPQLLQGFQGAAQGAQLPPEMAMAGAPQQGGGGIDLEALLRQLGYLR